MIAVDEATNVVDAAIVEDKRSRILFAAESGTRQAEIYSWFAVVSYDGKPWNGWYS